MTTLAIDPASAKPCAWAMRRHRSWLVGRVPAERAELVRVLSDAREAGATRVLVESCYLGANPLTYRRLVEVIERIKGACAEAGLPCEEVAAQTWKTGMLTVNGDFPRTREAQKARALQVAAWLGATVASDDEADAVCLAEYGDRMEVVR